MKTEVFAVKESEVSAILRPLNTAYKPRTPPPSPITGLPIGSACTLLPSLFSLVVSFSPRWLFKVAQVFSVTYGFQFYWLLWTASFLFICYFVTHLYQRKVWV